jgi:hypothetical protein
MVHDHSLEFVAPLRRQGGQDTGLLRSIRSCSGASTVSASAGRWLVEGAGP